MKDFSFHTARSIINEAGCSERLAALCHARGARSVLVVTDPGIRRLGLLDTPLAGFVGSGCNVSVYDAVHADPPESDVLAALRQARETGADTVVGFGGGSSMDVAKLVALLAHPQCGQSLADVYGVEKATGPRLRLAQVPTTAGTGSEVTNVAIVTTGETTKMGVSSPVLLPDLVLLDAQLTLGLPPHITAATGIDAMVHAIEAYTSRIRKNPYSDMLAIKALELLGGNLRQAVHEGSDRNARSAMLFGAMLAGQAFANAPVAAVHALAYPIGGRFHVPHGLSNSLVLPHVLAFNAPVASGLYAELAPIVAGTAAASGSDGMRCERLIRALETLIDDVKLPKTLREVGIGHEALDMLAEDAMLQQRLLVNNPREVALDDARAIYQAAL